MRITPFHSDRFRRPASGMISILIAVLLAGCASKNPLMEEPAVSARPSPVAMGSAAETAANAPANTTAVAKTPSGVQTEKQGRFLGFLSPYRPDIQQGNFISQEMVAQLREGMTREQVLFILGTPLLTDIFHAERWDYAFRYQKRNGEITNSRVTVFFKENRLARYEGGNLPTEEDYLARIVGTPPKPKASSPTDSQKAPSTANETR
jgi:outer membrane protein assembly factor BamE